MLLSETYQAVHDQAMAGALRFVLGRYTLPLQHLSSPRCINDRVTVNLNLVKLNLTKSTATSLADALVQPSLVKGRLTWFVSASFQRVCVCAPRSGCLFEQLASPVFFVSTRLVSPQAVVFWSRQHKRISSSVFSALPNPILPLFFLPLIESVLTCAWDGGS